MQAAGHVTVSASRAELDMDLQVAGSGGLFCRACGGAAEAERNFR